MAIMDGIYEEPVNQGLRGILKEYEAAAYKDLTLPQTNYFLGKFVKRVKKAYRKLATAVSTSQTAYPDLEYCKEDVCKIVEQVWKRKIYFRIFHKGVTDMNELKEAALYSFWILKLQPFYINGQVCSKSKLNTTIALYILMSGLFTYTDGMNKKEVARAKNEPAYKSRKFKYNLTPSKIPELHYSFKYRDWSKEALMDLTESLVIIE